MVTSCKHPDNSFLIVILSDRQHPSGTLQYSFGKGAPPGLDKGVWSRKNHSIILKGLLMQQMLPEPGHIKLLQPCRNLNYGTLKHKPLLRSVLICCLQYGAPAGSTSAAEHMDHSMAKRLRQLFNDCRNSVNCCGSRVQCGPGSVQCVGGAPTPRVGSRRYSAMFLYQGTSVHAPTC